jgi:hypothetical protein
LSREELRLKKAKAKIRRDYYEEQQKEALLTEHYADSIYNEHLNIFSDGRERGLWLGMQDDRDIEETQEITMFPGNAMLLEWPQVERLHKFLGEQLKSRK